jgi:hypothetical protein
MQVKEATKTADADASRLVDGSREHKGTAILDAFVQAGEYFAQHPEASDRSLVVFSDMVEESTRLRMTPKLLSSAGRTKLIAADRRAAALPKLDGVAVYVVGAGISSTRGKLLDRVAIERFWRSYLAAAGAQVKAYGPSLYAFP